MVKDVSCLFKSHSTWFAQRTAHPLQDADPGQLNLHWASRRTWNPAQAPLQWHCAGPLNMAGRVTALLAHPADPLKLYAGAAMGGVWRTKDGGLNWESTWPSWLNPNIGALAFDPAGPSTIYCATGEANVSPDCYPGSGIYVTRDGGDHWDVLADAQAAGMPLRIGALYVDPHTPGRMVIGGINLDESQSAGLYCSTDGGAHWERDNYFSRNPYWCHTVLGHPDGTLFAAIGVGGSQTGVWCKDAKGWRRLGKGMPAGDFLGRISLAMAPTKPEVLYALVGTRRTRAVQGVYRSADRGESWTQIDGGNFVNERQAQYNSTIVVHPGSPDTVAVGASDIWVSQDAGAHWAHVSNGNAPESDPTYVHFDQHALVMPGGRLLYAGCDGGVFFSDDLGASWKPRPNLMCTTSFYDVDVAPTNGKLMCGGTQDNGTLLAGVGDQPEQWLRVLRGDGAWSAFDPTDETHVFGSTSAIHIFRHTADQHWTEEFWLPKTPKDLTKEEHDQVSIAVMAIDPSHPRTVWVGSQRLWRTTDEAETWAPRSPVFDNSPITAIEIPPIATDQVWVGTRSGGIFCSLDRGATWSEDLSGPEIPKRVISRIETHPLSAGRLVVTVAGTGIAPPMAGDQFHSGAYGRGVGGGGDDGRNHVFCSENAGLTWRAIDSPEMPDVAYNAAVFETHEPHRLFVANDCGVWMTPDLATWTDVSAGLPSVMICDLVYHHKDRALIAATYGRGIWRTLVPGGADLPVRPATPPPPHPSTP
jgi:photosystem II stability/assembly factor-like uncharacterized protein